jgi:lipid-A-disaccharide synthase
VTRKLLVIAGEASGDLHGASLISELLNIDREIEIFGIGGDKMINAGLTPLYHINQMSFLGFAEIIRHLPFIRKVKSDLLKFVKVNKISKVVLIDYPGFNLSIAKSFRKLKIEIIYYISPQIWAWGHGRIKKIRKYIKRMIVFFPFEEKLYAENGIQSDFVGHPLAKSISEYKFAASDEIFEKYGLLNDKPLLLLMPGSRIQEVEKILPVLLKAAERLSEDYNLQTVVACADNIESDYFKKFKSDYDFQLVKGGTYDLLKSSKISIVKSGTSTLEAGLIGNPFIVVYKTNFFTYLIGRALIKIKNIALANIVAEKNVVSELIQHKVNPDNIYSECSKLLSDGKYYDKVKNDLVELRDKLVTEGNPNRKAAELIYAELNAQ